MIECPVKNNNLNVELMPFKKFCYGKNVFVSNDTFMLCGSFRDVVTGEEFIDCDVFKAFKIPKLSVDDIYKLYIEWFNYTINDFEHKREFISAKKFKEVLD